MRQVRAGTCGGWARANFRGRVSPARGSPHISGSGILSCAGSYYLDWVHASERDKWVSTNWFTANVVFFDRDTFWVFPLTDFYLPKSARTYLFTNPSKVISFAAAPLALTPFVRDQTPIPTLLSSGPKGISRKFESRNLGRDNLGGEIGHTWIGCAPVPTLPSSGPAPRTDSGSYATLGTSPRRPTLQSVRPLTITFIEHTI